MNRNCKKYNLSSADAEFSPCRTWRYALWRTWDHNEGYVAFIGLNPSTADETKNDPTVTRCIGYAKRWGYGGMIMLNIFAFRATDPKVMKKASDPVGPDNYKFLKMYHEFADITVACWGTHGAFGDQGKTVAKWLRRGKGLLCFGCTKEGHPKHPLYLRGDARLEPFLVGLV